MRSSHCDFNELKQIKGPHLRIKCATIHYTLKIKLLELVEHLYFAANHVFTVSSCSMKYIYKGNTEKVKYIL